MRVIGLDGFLHGWVAVRLDGDQKILSFHPDIADALSNPFDRAGIDIPIGMTEDGERACDLLARVKLRPYASRVFLGARRWIWEEFEERADASSEARRRGQSGVSCQLWNIGPKIMEVDAFLRTQGEADIREVHPELVFLRLNGNRPLPPKKSEEGDALRRRLLRRQGFRDIERWLTRARIGTGAKRDDVLDACAVAIAAREPVGHLPDGTPQLDAYRLPMQIWF